jgi:hypothetical protein
MGPHSSHCCPDPCCLCSTQVPLHAIWAAICSSAWALVRQPTIPALSAHRLTHTRLPQLNIRDCHTSHCRSHALAQQLTANPNCVWPDCLSVGQDHVLTPHVHTPRTYKHTCDMDAAPLWCTTKQQPHHSTQGQQASYSAQCGWQAVQDGPQPPNPAADQVNLHRRPNYTDSHSCTVQTRL